jgi:hypothetical protein
MQDEVHQPANQRSAPYQEERRASPTKAESAAELFFTIFLPKIVT